MILSIDPGTEQSAYLVYDSENSERPIAGWGIWKNSQVLAGIGLWSVNCSHLVIEQVASYGMPVGKEVFETVFWSGRFAQAWGREFHRLTRLEVKTHLCHSARAKDANVRQALIDRFGPKGTKKSPGKLYGLKSHAYAALAIAVTWHEQNKTL